MKLSRSSALFDFLIGAAGVLYIDLVQAALHLEDVAGVALDVRSLALEAARGLVHHDAGIRRGKAHALVAGSRSSEPIDAAWPMQSVETGGLMNCIVS